MQLLDTLENDPTESVSPELAAATIVVADLGDRNQPFEPGLYIGTAVKRALANR